MKYKIIKEIAMFAAIPLFSASVLGLAYLASVHRESLEKKEDQIARQEYSKLIKLADLDNDGLLSNIEKKLLVSRMDQNIPQNVHIMAIPYAKWGYCMTNPPNSFGGDVKNRIEKAIEMYQADLQDK